MKFVSIVFLLVLEMEHPGYKHEPRVKTSPILEIIRYELPDEQTKDFEAAYAKASNYLQQSPHCLSYKVVHNIEHPNRFVVLIHWDSIEGHTNGFSRSDLLKPFLAILHDYLPYIVEMNHYEETPVKWKRAKN